MPRGIPDGLRNKYPSEYTAYWNMRMRCYNINHPQYKEYGGRGIKICDRWLNSFKNFLEDMGEKT